MQTTYANVVDDLKWMATSLSILLLVIIVQWKWLRNTDVEMHNLSTMIASTEAGKKLASVPSAFSAVGNSPFLSSESINHFHNH